MTKWRRSVPGHVIHIHTTTINSSTWFSIRSTTLRPVSHQQQDLGLKGCDHHVSVELRGVHTYKAGQRDERHVTWNLVGPVAGLKGGDVDGLYRAILVSVIDDVSFRRWRLLKNGLITTSVVIEAATLK